MLVVNHLSAFAQPADLDLRPYLGWVPVELLGNTHSRRLPSGPISCPSARTPSTGCGWNEPPRLKSAIQDEQHSGSNRSDGQDVPHSLETQGRDKNHDTGGNQPAGQDEDA
jgi:hypothetical protein